jgi:hypothetical protein
MEHSVDLLAIDIQNMEARLTELEEKIDNIDGKLNQVIDAIMGNSLTKQGGFINDIELLNEKYKELELKTRRLESFKNRVYWTVGVGATALLLIQYLTTIYSNVK